MASMAAPWSSGTPVTAAMAPETLDPATQGPQCRHMTVAVSKNGLLKHRHALGAKLKAAITGAWASVGKPRIRALCGMGGTLCSGVPVHGCAHLSRSLTAIRHPAARRT
ncbi:MAG: hypothetical protein ACLSHU_09255 [Oscillospiraceae bacterium]